MLDTDAPEQASLEDEEPKIINPWRTRRGIIGIAVISLSILLCLLFGPTAGRTLQPINPTIDLAVERSDNDSRMIYDSIDAKPNFKSTFAWYHESWTLEMPFWRPLTMQSYWLQKAAFGEEHALNWLRVSVLLFI